MPGTRTSPIEVTNISGDGFRLHVGEEDLFLSFSNFPWFKSATTQQLCEIQQLSTDHLYWPSLDVDLSVQSIRNPSAFPLVAKVRV